MVLGGLGPSPGSHRRNLGQSTDDLIGLIGEWLSGRGASDSLPACHGHRECSRDSHVIQGAPGGPWDDGAPWPVHLRLTLLKLTIPEYLVTKVLSMP